LFNPNEAHLLGDLAIKGILKESLLKYNYLKNDDKRKRELSKNSFYSDNGNEWTVYDIDSTSFGESSVNIEFKAGESIGGKYSKIDLCIVCEEQELILFIENKYGCPEGEKQTLKYYDYLNKKFGKKYTCLFIYLDRYYDDENITQVNEHWILLNYDWIKRLLKSVIAQNSHSECTGKILKDYYIFITEDYNFDPYYTVCEDPIKLLSRNNRPLLRVLREAKSDKHNGTLVKDLELEQTLELCSRETKKNSTYRKLYSLYDKYWAILDEMEDYSFHDLLGESIQKELEIDESLIEIDSDYVLITHKIIDELGTDDEWPIYLEYIEKKGQDKEHFKFHMFFDLASLPEIYVDKVKEFIKVNLPNDNQRINPRYTKLFNFHFDEKPEIEDVIPLFVNRYKQISKLAESLQ